MESDAEVIIKKKNNWLTSQVDVQFPTPESIKGRDLYLAAEQGRQYVQIDASISSSEESVVDEIYRVDFHRLTVMFSLLQASKWEDKQEQAYILEYFSQIILNEECQLYIGFVDTYPVACAMVTQENGDILISDIVVDRIRSKSTCLPAWKAPETVFTAQLIQFLNLYPEVNKLWMGA
ncbi:flavodoxin [Vibrio sp. HA2012]|uniref:flavodoxin n=1 Tax=Vibrio sp. HA2012 TaxID=1971595 RepID=UPI000C2B7D32|nr:flavodoxin [Vibrio sp. HA2012]PJC87374.1 flavodoxin [Vibrio sp. HA2012]